LLGIAAMDGIIVPTFYNSAVEAGLGRSAAIPRTCQVQMRPALMTCLVAGFGLLPVALSTDIGSQVQRPLALVWSAALPLRPC
jgi:cobalt-zinc-cadmium resistance protein CzcA